MLMPLRKHFKVITWAIFSYVFGLLCSSLYFLNQKSDSTSTGAGVNGIRDSPRFPNSVDTLPPDLESTGNSKEPIHVLGDLQEGLLGRDYSKPADAEKYLNELFVVPDVFSSEEGVIGDEFAMVAGISTNERKDLEKIFMECLDEIKLCEDENLEQVGEDGRRYRLNSFAESGAAISDKFITEARNKLDPETFGRFMNLGYKQIYSKMSSFGRYAYDVRITHDSGELVMTFDPVGDFTDDVSSPSSVRYYVSDIPEKYKHLFKLGDANEKK